MTLPSLVSISASSRLFGVVIRRFFYDRVASRWPDIVGTDSELDDDGCSVESPELQGLILFTRSLNP